MSARPANSPLYLSFSKVALYERCPKAYWYRHIEKLEPDDEPLNLVYGSAVDETIEIGLNMLAAGMSVDWPNVFNDRWAALRAESVITSKTSKSSLSPDDMTTIGTKVITKFGQWWSQSGYQVLRRPTGQLALQESFEIDIGDNVKVTGKIDAILCNSAGGIVPADWKTAKQPAPPTFNTKSMQLTLYELAVWLAAAQYGIDRDDIAGSIFVELLKQKTDPRVEVSPLKGPRSQQDFTTAIARVRSVARRIREAEFFEREGLAFESPCKMCDYLGACHEQNFDGLHRREHTAKAA